MKTRFILLFLTFIVLNTIAQDNLTKVVYKNKNTKIKETYYTKASNATIKQGSYIAKLQGQIKAQGAFNENKRHGKWFFYQGYLKIEANYSNGLKQGTWLYIKGIDTISVLNYKDDKFHGEQSGYYKSGQVASIVRYKKGKKHGKTELYNKNGNIRELTNYQNGEYHGENIIFAEDGAMAYRFLFHNNIPVQFEKGKAKAKGYYFEGNLENGTGYLETFSIEGNGEKQLSLKQNFEDSVFHGKVNGYGKKGEPTFNGQFKNGMLLGEWNFYNYEGELRTTKTYAISDSLKFDPEEGQTRYFKNIFFIVEHMPEFPGGDMNLRKIIARSLKYPKFCALNKIQGRVFVQFVVSTTGEVEQVKAVRKVHPELDKEAIRVIQELPYWVPGFQHGIPVNVSFTVPINFALN